MGKKLILKGIIASMGFLFMITGLASGDGMFENGFRGTAWGTHKDQLPDLGLTVAALNNIYKKGHASVIFMPGSGTLAMEFEGIPLLSIYLNFYDQVLFGADLVFAPEYRQKVFERISRDMGAGVSTQGSPDIQWQTRTLSILLTGHELLIVSEPFNPDKSASNPSMTGSSPEPPCCSKAAGG